MRVLAVTLLCVLGISTAHAQTKSVDPWQPLRFLLGQWQGSAQGEPGRGSVERQYELVLGDKFIEEHNTSSYEARQPGVAPEVHHHRGFFSYDKARKALMLRHFHEEGFVNLYAMNTTLSSGRRLVFDSVSFENFSNDWKARETYEVVSDDEFIETFELAEPGKELQVYSRSRFKRRK